MTKRQHDVSAFLSNDSVPHGGVATKRRFRTRRAALLHAQAVSLGAANLDDGPKRALYHGSDNWDIWFHPGGRIERLPKQLWGTVS